MGVTTAGERQSLSIEQVQLIWFVRSYNLGFAADYGPCKVEAADRPAGSFSLPCGIRSAHHGVRQQQQQRARKTACTVCGDRALNRCGDVGPVAMRRRRAIARGAADKLAGARSRGAIAAVADERLGTK